MTIGRLRLASGLILAAYLVTHLMNHALGLVSLTAMERGLAWFRLLWDSGPGTIALFGALLTHLVVALWSIYRRRHLRMAGWQAAQLALGLIIPPILLAHIVGTRLATEAFGVEGSYTRVVLALGYLDPAGGVRQCLVLVIAWAHACIGLHFWLRLWPWYRHVSLWLFGIAVLLPALALLGFLEAAGEVAQLAQAPGWIEATLRASNAPTPAQAAVLERVRGTLIVLYVALLALTLVARGVRALVARGLRSLRVTYPSGRTVVAPHGLTLLEVSRYADIPHASVCGGRGRCTTCRVRIVDGLPALPLPSQAEARVLRRIGAGNGVRLACQTRPRGDVAIVPLVAASAAGGRSETPQGRELDIAVLFADLRGFTTLAERKLPYDVVFVLNRYFEVVGAAIAAAGGIANQFTGDGVMALFGVDSDPRDGCRRAIAAAGAMAAGVAALSRELVDDLHAPLRLGIGVHTGSAVVGRMGYGTNTYLTAVGDIVHVASRLEQLTKEFDSLLVISEEVAAAAGLDVSRLPRHEVQVRNRHRPVVVYIVGDATLIPS